ncbi:MULTISPECIES: hypothetical protein [Lysinibacillus]|nr:MULTISPECIES: hypothetical protein [Lysinibacillus]UUV26804.1 hypothetical protein NP781_09550 [Lysinibacillus sp. FN11]UYB49689.1 hypothetical protein OCI51_12235 [Lysinibacillus capsici]WDU81676.1 hypothetical protein PSR12_11045 [Lysinibacillus sp. G01H]
MQTQTVERQGISLMTLAWLKYLLMKRMDEKDELCKGFYRINNVMFHA